MIDRSASPLVFAALLLFLCNPSVAVEGDSAATADPPAWQPQIPYEVSPETTLLTEPLREDGSVDYIAALNAHLGEGVTPQNNAMVGYVRAYGPAAVLSHVREPFCDLLGIEPLPVDGKYLVYKSDYIAGLQLSEPAAGKIRDDFRTALSSDSGCWLPEAYPQVAQWLEVNQAPLDAIVEASRLPRFYRPLIYLPTGLQGPEIGELPYVEQMPCFQADKEVIKALTTRARVKAAGGDSEGALADLLASRRLARHAGNAPGALNLILARWMQATILLAEQRVFSCGPLTLDQAEQYRQQLEALPPRRTLAQMIDLDERYLVLNHALTMYHKGPWALRTAGVRSRPGNLPLNNWDTLFALADWNRVLHDVNSCCDQMRDAVSAADYQQQCEKMGEIDEQLDGIEFEIRHFNFSYRRFFSPFWSRPHEEVLADAIIAPYLGVYLAPGKPLLDLEQDALAQERITTLAVALAAYRARTGEYPESLDALQPADVAELPFDPFTSKPFEYRPVENGYVLYSVGRNLLDDGGVWETPTGEPADIVFQVQELPQ